MEYRLIRTPLTRNVSLPVDLFVIRCVTREEETFFGFFFFVIESVAMAHRRLSVVDHNGINLMTFHGTALSVNIQLNGTAVADEYFPC